MQAQRLPKDGPRVSIQLLFLATLSAVALGVLVGFICGYLMPR
jgi:ABC-type dipeptide/oligopeptide/nickel transport system permease subunit